MIGEDENLDFPGQTAVPYKSPIDVLPKQQRRRLIKERDKSRDIVKEVIIVAGDKFNMIQ